MSSSSADSSVPGSVPDRTRRRLIVETRTRVRAMGVQVPFTVLWLEQLEQVLKPTVRVALAEELSSHQQQQQQPHRANSLIFPRVAWLPAVAPSRCRPTPADALVPTHDPSHPNREALLFNGQQQPQGPYGATSGGAPAYAPSSTAAGGATSSASSSVGGGGGGDEPSAVPLARRPSMSNVSGTSHLTVGVVADASTVWERGEIISRVLIEEGKTATVLRVYTDLVAFLCTNGLPRSATLGAVGADEICSNWPYETAHFVVNGGYLLRNILYTVEAAQVIDGFDFLQHVFTVFAPFRQGPGTAASAPGTLGPPSDVLPSEITDLLQCQALVLTSTYFLWLDNIANVEQLMERSLEEGLFVTLLHYGERHQLVLPPAASLFQLDAPLRASFIRLMLSWVSSEGFLTRRDRFFSSKAVKDLFARVMDATIRAHFFGSATATATMPPDVKRELRPLLDLVLRFK